MLTRSHKFHVPQEVEHLCSILFKAGEDAYIVGGSLRDLLSNRTPSDWDIATSATPVKVIKIFKRTVPTGIKHGTVTVLINNTPMEVTTLRGEGDYTDGRRPDNVTFICDIEEDLSRRDFTINAMAWDPATQLLHDPFDGQKDLKAKVIKAVGDPTRRFEEDGLRLLRAARFAATLKFKIEPLTLKAMPGTSSTLEKVSIERKRDELIKTLGATSPSLGLNVMAQTSLLCYISRHLAKLTGKNWEEALCRVDNTPIELRLRLASLLMGTKEKNREWLTDMRFDRQTIMKTTHLLTILEEVDFNLKYTDANIRRLLNHMGRNAIDDFFAVKKAAQITCKRPEAELQTFKDRVNLILASNAPLSIKELAIRGSDIINILNIPPGPQIGYLLNALLEHVQNIPEDNSQNRLLNVAQGLIDCKSSSR